MKDHLFIALLSLSLLLVCLEQAAKAQDSTKRESAVEKKKEVEEQGNLPKNGFNLHNSNFWNYLGFGGGTYYSEVPIPIQAIRFEDDGRSADFPDSHHGTFIIDYTKATSTWNFYGTTYPIAAGKKLAEPFISPFIVYSIYSDPFTGETLIAIRPEVGFENIKSKKFLKPAQGLPVPMDEAEYSPGAVPGIQGNQAFKGNQAPIVDNNSSAIVIVEDTTEKYAIDWKNYLFVPDGGKLPNFGQVMESNWFTSGPLSVMVKIHPSIPAKGKLPALPSQSSAGINFAIVTGSKHTYRFDKAKNGRLYKTPISYAFPLFMIGANTTSVSIPNDSVGKPATKYISDGTQVALNWGAGAGLQIGSFALNGVVGQDFLLGSDAQKWPYERKLWYGFSIGISLDKLLGISQSVTGQGGGQNTSGGAGQAIGAGSQN